MIIKVVMILAKVKVLTSQIGHMGHVWLRFVVDW